MRVALRELLPARRRSETFELKHGGKNTVFAVTIGFYDDHKPGEVFISGAKAGSELDAVARDGAVLISLGLQYGIPLESMQKTITRNEDGTPSTIVGAVIDIMVEKQNG